MVVGFVSPQLPSWFGSQVGWGDFAAAVLALLSMAALTWRWTFALPIVWVFNLEGAADLLNAYFKGVTRIADPGLFGAGIYIPTPYVPILLISHTLAFIILSRAQLDPQKS